MYLVGIDIGGTTVKMGILTPEAKIIEKWEIPTDTSDGGTKILPDIAKSLKEHLANRGISNEELMGIGFGVPGPVKNSIVSHCVNLGWDDIDVPKLFSKYFPCDARIVAGNDANVAAYGEYRTNSDKTINSVVMITLGTGVGGGIIVDGRPIDGANGAAGEFGHVHVDDEFNFTCNCGAVGCLETVASGRGMRNMALVLAHGKKTTLNSYDPALLTCKEVFDEAEKGDEASIEAVEKFGHYLGMATANVAAAIDPECIIFGGGVSRAGQPLLDLVLKYHKKYVFKGCKNTKFALAKLGNDAGIVGAALLSTI